MCQAFPITFTGVTLVIYFIVTYIKLPLPVILTILEAS